MALNTGTDNILFRLAIHLLGVVQPFPLECMGYATLVKLIILIVRLLTTDVTVMKPKPIALVSAQ